MIGACLLRGWARQRWLPFGVRDRLLRLLVPPERLGGQSFDTRVFGLRYRGDLGNFVDWMVYFYGTYERGIQTLLGHAGDQAGPGAVFLDIGANIGLHSLYMSAHAQHIHAFEPWLPARTRLSAAVADNDLRLIALHPFALGEHDCELPFYEPASANLGTGSFCRGLNVNRPHGVLPVRQGDGVLNALGLDRVDVIKIDTEGFEIEVLRGLRQSLARFNPVVVVEISPRAHGSLEDLDLAGLFPPGWDVVWIDDHPERYRLRTKVPQDCMSVMILAGPPEKVRALPRRG